MKLTSLLRALRLPFSSASMLPYLYGSLLVDGPLRWTPLALGGAVALLTHLSANVINDYADSRSGADGVDPSYYGFFGGSKVIQDGLMKPRHVLAMASALAAGAFVAVVLLAMHMRSPLIVLLYLGVLALGWAYSCPPASLSYRGLGELTIGILFGGVTVAGGAFTQSGLLFSPAVVLAALLHGLLVMGIILCNEIPDAETDRAAGKRTLVVLLGPERGWLLFSAAASGAALCLVIMLCLRVVRPAALIAFIAVWPAWRAARIMRTAVGNKKELVRASRAAISTHCLAGLGLLAERCL
ncbi:prenyltransferase [Verrucomicrobiota bacterium]